MFKDNDPDTLNDDIKELRNMLTQKYSKLNQKDICYYADIVKYIQDKNKKGIIEGGSLADMDINELKGTIVVKRTARLKCYLRSAWRDYKNPVWRKGLNTFGLLKRFIHCYKRRIHHIFPQRYIEEFISKLENQSLI